jgi:hypothetical protein
MLSCFSFATRPPIFTFFHLQFAILRRLASVQAIKNRFCEWVERFVFGVAMRRRMMHGSWFSANDHARDTFNVHPIINRLHRGVEERNQKWILIAELIRKRVSLVCAYSPGVQDLSTSKTTELFKSLSTYIFSQTIFSCLSCLVMLLPLCVSAFFMLPNIFFSLVSTFSYLLSKIY